MTNKRSGILMSIHALPSKEGIGTLGKPAFDFIDFLSSSKQSLWQILPVSPTGYGNSPYAPFSAFGLNYYFIDLNILVKKKLLKKVDIANFDLYTTDNRVDYGKLFFNKIKLLKKAFSNFDTLCSDFVKFQKSNNFDDFALFMSLKGKFSYKPFTEWDFPYNRFDAKIINNYKKNNNDYLFWLWTQFEFTNQWLSLKNYANSKNIKIIGDLPLYLSFDSVEMWKYGNQLFQVNDNFIPSAVAGVPPDAFSNDGQLWGNPLYNWEKMKSDNYKWWRGRINYLLKLFDYLRIDHFRGLDRYFAVPYGDINARNGVWKDGPKEELFKGIKKDKIIAEDLGVIDDGVIRLMNNTGFCGMKVLSFAFDGRQNNDHKPSNYKSDIICYTGTHDNMPIKGYIQGLKGYEKEVFVNDLKSECKYANISCKTNSPVSLTQKIVELAFSSKANTVIIPFADVICKGAEARINAPSTNCDDNWTYRFTKKDFTPKTVQRLKDLTIKYKR